MKCDRCQAEATVHEVVIRHGKRAERHVCERCAAKLGLFGPEAGSAPVLPNEPLAPTVTADQVGPPLPAGEAKGDAGDGEGVGGPPAMTFSLVSKLPGGGDRATRPGACRGCGLTMAQFRQTERLGCPQCYDDLGASLASLIERVNEGASCHVGKKPRRLGAEPASGEGGGRAMASSGQPNLEGDARERAAGRARGDAVEVAARRKALRDRLVQAVSLEQYELAAKLRDELSKLDAMLVTGLVQPGAGESEQGRGRGGLDSGGGAPS